MQQMRLAESDPGVDVERIEHDHVAPPALCDLLGRGMGQRVGAPDHECLEGEARIEGRTAEGIVRRRDRAHRMAAVAAVELDLAHLALRRGTFRLFDFRRQGADHRRAHGELDARKGRLLGLPAGQHPLGVVRLDPALEEARGHRELDGIAFAAVEFHAGEPACVNIVADFGAKAILHAGPSVQIHARHCVSLLDRRKPTGNADETRYFDAKWHHAGERRSEECCGAAEGPEGNSGGPVAAGGMNVRAEVAPAREQR